MSKPILALAGDAAADLEDLRVRVEDLGWIVNAEARTLSKVIDVCSQAEPTLDLLLVDNSGGAFDVGNLMDALRQNPRGHCPVILLVRQMPPPQIRKAAELGVSQILFHPVNRSSLSAALWTCAELGKEIRRVSSQAQSFQSQVQALQSTLDERKQVEIAKGLLMSRHGWPEQKAYEQLRRASQNHRQSMAALASSVIQDQKDFLEFF